MQNIEYWKQTNMWRFVPLYALDYNYMYISFKILFYHFAYLYDLLNHLFPNEQCMLTLYYTPVNKDKEIWWHVYAMFSRSQTSSCNLITAISLRLLSKVTHLLSIYLIFACHLMYILWGSGSIFRSMR